MSVSLTSTDKRWLLKLAREALEAAVCERPPADVDEPGLPPSLLCPGGCFVTLTAGGQLRGCIGTLQADLPLYQDVRLRAAQAALQDYRFAQVMPAELPEIEVEISVLTAPEPVEYGRPAELPGRLRPGVDGVILKLGRQRATFLPQVWEHVPDPERFLDLLCDKLGVPPDTWRRARLEVYRYQVVKFTEAELKAEPGVDRAVPLATD